jgi:polysaccharide export outer membrane protein
MASIVLSCLSTATVGCKSAHYRASDMPTQLRAAHATPTSQINVASMVGPGTNTSQVSAGDLLEITIASGRNDEKVEPIQVRVTQDGVVNAPPIGPVSVAGLEPIAAEQRIAQAAIQRGIFVQPAVTLKMAAPAVNRITVLGAVEKPGVVELPKGSSDLARALAAAGGMTKEAGTEVDIVRHNEPTFLAGTGNTSAAAGNGVELASYTAGLSDGSQASVSDTPVGQAPTAPQSSRIDLAQLTPNSPNARYGLSDRDVVMVLPKEKQLIHVTGLVRTPNQFELPHDQDVTVMDAISLAGGVSSPVADKVFVIRRLPDMAEPAVIQVSIAEAKRNGNENLRLAPGDLVSVERTPSTVLVDSVMTMFRVGFSVGGNLVAF